MKIFNSTAVMLVAAICALALESRAQEISSEEHTIWFDGEPYQYQSATNNPNALMNVYFPMLQSADSPRRRIMTAGFPSLGSCLDYVQYIGQQLREKQPNARFSIMPDSNPNRAVCAMLTQTGGGPTYMIEVWQYVKPNPNWDSVLGTQFAILAVGDEGRSTLETMLNEKLKTWGSEIMALKVPLPMLPFKEEAVGDKSALGGLVKVEGFKAGRAVKVDAEFAKQLGAPEPPKAPFQVLAPFGEKNLKINGAPNVPEIAVFAVTTDDNSIVEAVRYTSLSHDAMPDVKKGLLPLSWIIENGMSSSLFSKYGGQVVDRYRTKIGEYDAAVVLGESANSEGSNYYFKFVALPKPNATDGLAVAIMIDKDKASDVNSVADTMTKGFSAKMLHSTIFLETNQ